MSKSKLPFYKYQGTGNDFIIINAIDNSDVEIHNSNVIKLCDRKFGIGADGLMLLRVSDAYDFEMIYYNADGGLSTMCGNGGRCIAHLAFQLGFAGEKIHFKAADGPHLAEIKHEMVDLTMQDVPLIKQYGNVDFELNTGSPHYVRFCDQHQLSEIVKTGKEIRYSEAYAKDGINVNLANLTEKGELNVATYERGVEDETLSCGTGVTAAALAAAHHYQLTSPIAVVTKGGQLHVHFVKTESGFTNVVLSGPVEHVFSGIVSL